MPVVCSPHLTHDAIHVFTGCHTPTGWRVLERCGQPQRAIAVGDPGPWVDQATRRGYTVAPIDLLAPDAADRLSIRLLDTRLRVFHPLTQLPTHALLRSTSTLLAALGRSGARVERFVLGGSACVWRGHQHRWAVGDGSALPPAVSHRSGAYAACERLAEHALPSVLTKLRAAPIWDGAERGLRTRLAKPWIPQPKMGRALLDPLLLDDWMDAVGRTMEAGPRAYGATIGLPGPEPLQAKRLAGMAGARVVAMPSLVSELIGGMQLFGWDRDTAIVMAWTLTLSGVAARTILDWEAQRPLS
jgi:hypothetical protein